jgi:hypothetical protein
MESRSLQELVKRLFSEEKTKAEFITNPDSVLSHYSLTDQEKKAVLTTYSRVGLVSGGSVALDATIEPLIFWV